MLPAPPPRRATLTGERRERAALAARTFLERAVLRVERGDTWGLVTPGFRRHFTRREWRSGTTAVVPYRGRIDRVGVEAVYADRVELAVHLVPHGRTGDPGASFALELRPGPGRAWLVSYWAPQATLDPRPPSTAAPLRGRAAPSGGISQVWLVLPVGFVGGGLLLVCGLGARGWHRGTRARRAYERTRI